MKCNWHFYFIISSGDLAMHVHWIKIQTRYLNLDFGCHVLRLILHWTERKIRSKEHSTSFNHWSSVYHQAYTIYMYNKLNVSQQQIHKTFLYMHISNNCKYSGVTIKTNSSRVEGWSQSFQSWAIHFLILRDPEGSCSVVYNLSQFSLVLQNGNQNLSGLMIFDHQPWRPL